MTELQYHPGRPSNYRLSGLISPQAFAIGIPLCLLLAAAIGFAAGMLEFFCHLLRFIYMLFVGELLTVAATGALLGLLNASLLEALGSRSRIFNLFTTLASCCVALYFAWAGWLFHLALYSNHLTSPLKSLNPLALVYFIVILYHHGAYTLLGEEVTGPLLALFWLAEAAGIFGFALKIATARSGKRVFCEHCKKWGTRRILMEFRDDHIPELQAALLAGNLDALSAVSPRDLEDDRWCCLLLEGCPACDNTQTLTLQRTRFVRESNGRTRIKNTPLAYRLFVTPEQTAKLATIAASIPPIQNPRPT